MAEQEQEGSSRYMTEQGGSVRDVLVDVDQGSGFQPPNRNPQPPTISTRRQMTEQEQGGSSRQMTEQGGSVRDVDVDQGSPASIPAWVYECVSVWVYEGVSVWMYAFVTVWVYECGGV